MDREPSLPDPVTDADVVRWFNRQADRLRTGEIGSARALARRFAARVRGGGRLMLIAPLVEAYLQAGQPVRARRLQRFLLRRLPNVTAVEQDYIALAASTGRAGNAYARLETSAARRADPGAWRALELVLAPQLIASGHAPEARALARRLLEAGERDWTVLAALAWASGALGRLGGDFDQVRAAAATLETEADRILAYRFVRLCAAYGYEAEAMRWLLSGPEASAVDLAWAAPYADRAGVAHALGAEWAAVRALVHDPSADPAPQADAGAGVDVVADFKREIGGSEEHAIDLAHLLGETVPVRLWSLAGVHPRHAARGVRELDGPIQAGGVLTIVGAWHAPSAWLDRFSPDRVVIVYNTFNAPQLFNLIRGVSGRTRGKIELAYASDLMRREVGLPGRLEISPITIPQPEARTDRSGPVVVGRLSRDSFDKHHAEDARVYAALLDRGVEVRVLGGESLRRQLPPRPGLVLRAAEGGATSAFLSELDVFFYRTGAWLEPCARVVFEAMGSGLPVVVDDSGGHAELIRDGVDGFVVGSTEAALERLLGLCADADLRREMGSRARARFETLYGPEAREALKRAYIGPDTRLDP